MGGLADSRIPDRGGGQSEAARRWLRARRRHRDRRRVADGILARSEGDARAFDRARSRDACDRGRAVTIVVLGFGDAMQVTVIAFGVCFSVLVTTTDGVRAVSPEVRDTASMLQVGPVERPPASTCRRRSRRLSPGCGSRSRSDSSWSSSPSSSARATTGWGTTSSCSNPCSTLLPCTAASCFLGLLGYALNRLFLLVERRVLFWHDGQSVSWLAEAMSPAPVIARAVHRFYGPRVWEAVCGRRTGGPERRHVRGVRGELFAVVGPSGCGKTTLLRLLCGLMPASEGAVLFHGRL